jgi:hypothetical protein
MKPELVAALEPVLRDLATPEGVLPEVRDEPWGAAGTASAMLYAADGSGGGISIEVGSPLPTQVAALADQVQDWAVEALWSLHRPTNWPPCPRHPGRHPLAADEISGRAVWICPADKTEVSAIGDVAGTCP